MGNEIRINASIASYLAQLYGTPIVLSSEKYHMIKKT